MMKKTEKKVIHMQIDRCMVTLCFAERENEGVMAKVKSVLSYAYEERVKSELLGCAGPQYPISEN